MDCEICFESLDLQAHRPKVLPCGHTVCLQCLQRLPRRHCPTCRKPFISEPADFPTNFRLLDVVELSTQQKAKPDASRQWCWDCCEVAMEDCVGQHRLSDLHAALHQVFQPFNAEDVQTLTASLSDQQAVSALSLLCPADPAVSRTVTLSSEGQAALEWKVPAGRDEEGAAAAARDTGVRARILSALTIIMVRDAVQKDLDATEEDGRLKEKRAEAGVDSLDVASLTFPLLREKKEEKAALLDRVREHGVRKLYGVHCQRDPDWCLQLVETAAPFLEELEVEYVSAEMVMTLLFMPRLRRLLLVANPQTLKDQPPARLPQICAPKYETLQRLELRGLPLKTVGDLLLLCGASLQVLVLWVGCSFLTQDDWPSNYAGVGDLLERAGLRALRRVLLRRSTSYYLHSKCEMQMAGIRTKLPGVTALCSICDKNSQLIAEFGEVSLNG